MYTFVHIMCIPPLDPQWHIMVPVRNIHLLSTFADVNMFCITRYLNQTESIMKSGIPKWGSEILNQDF